MEKNSGSANEGLEVTIDFLERWKMRHKEWDKLPLAASPLNERLSLNPVDGDVLIMTRSRLFGACYC
jgi:hypothetical protein